MIDIKQWFDENLAGQAGEILERGAGDGFKGITYIQDCVDLHDDCFGESNHSPMMKQLTIWMAIQKEAEKIS